MGAPLRSGALGAVGVVPTETPSFRPTLTGTPTRFVAPSEATGEGPRATFQLPQRQPTSREASIFNYRYGSQFNSYAGESSSTSGSFKALYDKLGKDNHRLQYFFKRLPFQRKITHLRNSRKACNSCGSPFTRESRFRQLPLFSPQKRRWSETGGDLKATEPIPSFRALQKGRNSYGERSSKKRRFYGQDRSQRRIFHNPPLPGTSKVRAIQGGRHPFPVCLPPLWPVHYPFILSWRK